MIIQGTKRFLDELGLRRRWLSHIGKKEYPRGLFDWYAHVINADEKVWIVLVNNLTRYPVVVLKNEYFQIELIPDYLLETLRGEGIHEEILACYRRNMGYFLIDKTCDRELTQKLSYTCEEVKRCLYLADQTVCVQTKVSREAAKKRVHYSEIGYKAPAERMFESLERLKTEYALTVPLFDLKVLDLLIKLEIPENKVEVRVSVPDNITFLRFHELILKLFDWNVKGEHKFICAENVVDELMELREIEWENGLIYEYWMPGYHRWRHITQLLGEKPHQQMRDAVATACRGRRPPWNLDGPDQYKWYQMSLDDSSHPDHERAQILQNRYGARRLSLREINVELKWVMMSSMNR